MELSEAKKILKELKNSKWYEYAGDSGKKLLSVEEEEAINTILQEIGKLHNQKQTLRDGLELIENKCKNTTCKDCSIADICEITSHLFPDILDVKEQIVLAVERIKGTDTNVGSKRGE